MGANPAELRSGGPHPDLSPQAAEGAGFIRILENVGFGLEAGDRIGLLGPNGAGKSTLVKTLVGELPVLAGERSAHPDMQLGYFAQHTVESLIPGASPVDHLRELAPNVVVQDFRDFLGRWNFPGNRAFESVDTFSGGERARLALALIAWRKPNVLLLDEPTNHLDLDMREALAEALSDFDGAIVLVSHDRHLIGLVCDSFWRVADGHVEAFDGDLDAYAAWLRSRNAEARGTAKSAMTADTAPDQSDAPKRPVARKAAIKIDARAIERAEARVTALERELAGIDAQQADPDLYAAGGERIAELGRQQAKLRDDLARAEQDLLDIYEAQA